MRVTINGVYQTMSATLPMKHQYKLVRKQYPLWERSMVLHYLAGWNGVTLREIKSSLLRELKDSKG